MPKYVYVSRVGINFYEVHGDEAAIRLYSGNREQVHFWLGQNDYKQYVHDNTSLDIEGGYRHAAA